MGDKKLINLRITKKALISSLLLVTSCTEMKSNEKSTKPEDTEETKGNEEKTENKDTEVIPIEGTFLGLGIRKQKDGIKLVEEVKQTDESDHSKNKEPVPEDAEVVLQQFKIDNSILQEVPVSNEIKQVSWGRDGRVFGISDHNAFELDAKTGAQTDLNISTCDSRISWLDGITWDSKNDRILVSSGWADGLLCSFDPASKTWKLVGEFEAWQNYVGIVYDVKADNLIVIPGDMSNPNVSVGRIIKRISASDASLVPGSEIKLSEDLRVVHSWFSGGVQFNLKDDTLVVRSIFAADGMGGGIGNGSGTMHTEIRQVNITNGSVVTVLSTLNDEIAKHTQPHSDAGNIILLGNYEGGEFTLDIDVAIDNLKIGIVSYEAINVSIIGAHKDKVSEVSIIGYQDSSVVNGIPKELYNIKSDNDLPNTTYEDPNGSSSIACVSAAEDGGGCASMGQVEAYFRKYFNGSVRLFTAKYSKFSGTIKLSEIKDGAVKDE
jgi:hypothetical protein